METHQQPLLPVAIEPIVALVQEKVPKMQKARDGAVVAMREFYVKFNELFKKYQQDPGLKDTMDGMVQEANDLLVKVKTTYDGIYAMRKGITDTTDQIKEYLMQFEKDLSYDAKANTGYNHIRNIIQQFKQAELDNKKKAEEAAARKREIENYKVDLVTAMKKNLLDLISAKIDKVNLNSRAFFDKTTLEEWDNAVTVFTSARPKLKQEDYEKCFDVFYDNTKVAADAFAKLINQARLDEPYDKWVEKIELAVTPILNEWRAKIPDIKRQKIELSRANEDEKRVLETKNAAQAKAEDERRKTEADRLQKAEQAEIDRQAEVDRMKNNFVEQASNQLLEDAGPSKKVLKFSEKKEEQGQAFMSIVYHVMLNEKFLFYKKDKEEYTDAVGWFVRFFETHCKDRTVEGATWTDQAKVIVRK
jgi:hypothetical protein